MARYYTLAYEEDNQLKPIDLSVIENFENHELSTIICFTTSFDNEKELKDLLGAAGLIPNKDIDLRYVLRTPVQGRRNEYTYNKIRYGSNIYYKNYKDCFDVNVAKKYFYDNILDENFYDRVFYNVCCELHVKQTICNLIEDGLKPANYANFIVKLKERINSPRVKEIVRYLEPDHYPREKGNIIRELFKALNSNPIVVIEFVKKFGDELVINNAKVGRMPSIVALNALWGMINTINNNKQYNVPSSKELLVDFDKTFDELWQALTETKTGALSDRQSQNVGMFIAHNEYYRSVVGKGRTISQDPIEALTDDEVEALSTYYVSKDDCDKEEFITEEDFELHGTTPEEQGFHIDTSRSKK